MRDTAGLCGVLVCLSAALPLLIGADGKNTAGAAGQPLLNVLRGELDREFPILKTKGDPAAYYIAYEVSDVRSDTATATLGALVSSNHNRVRGLDTTVRVGSPSFDNYHPYRGTRGQFDRFTPLSLDDVPNQIRRALWEETDRVYKAGTRRLLQLKTGEQLIAESEQHDADFSEEPPEHFSDVPETFPYDAETWNRKLRVWSAEFRKHPALLGSEVSVQAQRTVRTFADTEGSAIMQGGNLFRIEVSAEGVASDGMGVRTYSTFEAADPAHLPSDKVVMARVQDIAAKVDALVKAPPAEPIVCPAILSGRAAAVFFHEIFGHRVEGHRQKDIEEGQTFTKMLGHPVLPAFVSVKFDPTERQYQGHDLIGAYAYDDEGVKARPVSVVENGILKTFLLARSPVGQFTHSNGHGRRQPGFEVVARQSNLIVESSKQVSNSGLRAELLAEIRRQNKPYGLYFEEVASGYTTTGRRGLQAFTVVPLIVYRVYADGRPDELIRGVDIVGTPLASFQKILATSDKAEVFNGYCGAESGSIPVSAVSPAILVSEIEIEKKRNAQQRLPILPRPEGE
ncbi:MAG TPA: metallopeptidase TldD-related protein [Bryobacteraceae bacterium]|nr:metallopeptidase TldD-related protein [Bryobacteraceae bacterium]